MQGKYTVKGMGFHAFHGSLEIERELGSVYYVDVMLSLDLTADDDSQKAVGKIQGADVYDITKSLVMGTKFNSTMSLALHISRELLRKYLFVAETTVKVTSKHLYIAGEVESVIAEASSTRKDI